MTTYTTQILALKYGIPVSETTGLITGSSTMNKFGANPNITTSNDPADIWDYGGIYTFSATANIDQISSSAADTQDLTVIGLDSNWEEVTQTKTLTGTTGATLDTPLIRVYRAYNSGATDFTGDVYITTTDAELTDGVPDTAADVRAKITIGHNQTLMCVYTVPEGKTAYLVNVYVALSGTGVQAESAQVVWSARPVGGVFQTKSEVSLVTTGNSTWDHTYEAPIALPERTDIKVTCIEVTADMSVSGGFDLILVDN